MTLKARSFDIAIKAASGDDDQDYGHFEGYGSVFGGVDSYRAVVEKGAFVDSIKKKMLKLLCGTPADSLLASFWKLAKTRRASTSRAT